MSLGFKRLKSHSSIRSVNF